MDYEKAYKTSLKTAAQWIKDGCTDKEKICLECVFLELREINDERIRKWLLECVENLSDGNFIEVSKQDVLFYLEKQKELPFVKDVVPGLPGLYFYDGERMHFQGSPAMEEKQKEQKYIGLSETDKFFLEGVANVLVDNEYKDAAKRLRDLSESLYLQPKGVWSEEDERLIKTSISFLKDFADTGWENAVECIDWLKYLPMRCQKSSDNGKPSEEQQMPDSTQLIAEWEREKAVLEQKDFRGDAERMAYNAFLDGFVKGIGYGCTK